MKKKTRCCQVVLIMRLRQVNFLYTFRNEPIKTHLIFLFFMEIRKKFQRKLNFVKLKLKNLICRIRFSKLMSQTRDLYIIIQY